MVNFISCYSCDWCVFFYGIFAMQLGNMIRIKRETGLTYRSQISVSWSEFTKKIKH